MKTHKALGIGALIFVGLSLILIPVLIEVRATAVAAEETRELVQSQARWLVLQDNPLEAANTVSKNDAWGNPLVYQVEVTEYAIIAVVTSAGPDGEYAQDDVTDSDDIYHVEEDFNKSRIIGKWVGKRAKEFGKGLLEGIKDKAKDKLKGE